MVSKTEEDCDSSSDSESTDPTRKYSIDVLSDRRDSFRELKRESNSVQNQLVGVLLATLALLTFIIGNTNVETNKILESRYLLIGIIVWVSTLGATIHSQYSIRRKFQYISEKVNSYKYTQAGWQKDRVADGFFGDYSKESTERWRLYGCNLFAILSGLFFLLGAVELFTDPAFLIGLIVMFGFIGTVTSVVFGVGFDFLHNIATRVLEWASAKLEEDQEVIIVKDD